MNFFDILDITFLIVIFISFFGVIINCFLLYIYLKNGDINQIKLYKIFLLIMCLLISVENIISFFLYHSQETKSFFCKLIGTLKFPFEIGIDAIQVSLLVITYYSLEYQTFLINNPTSFKLLVLAFCWILPILTGIFECIDSFYLYPNIQRNPLCMKININIFSIFFFSLLFYLILFIVFLRKLNKSINSIEIEENERKVKYKKKLNKYYYGFAFSFPNSFCLILLAILDFIISIFPESHRNYTINFIFEMIIVIVNGLSPFVIILIYCYYWKKLCCCKKEIEEEENPTTSMILFSSEDNE